MYHLWRKGTTKGLNMNWTKIPTNLLINRIPNNELIAIVKYQLLWAELEYQPTDETALRYMTNTQLTLVKRWLNTIEAQVVSDIKSAIKHRGGQKLYYKKNQELSENNDNHTDSQADGQADGHTDRADKIRLDKIRITPLTPLTANDKFEVLWQAYTPYVSPDGKSVNKGAKKPAKEKFNKIIAKGVNPDEIILGAKNYIADCFEHKCLTKNLITFLNQEQWKEHLVATVHPCEKDAEDFVKHWNEMVYKGITASDKFAQVSEATIDEVKNLLQNVGKTILGIMQETKKRMSKGEKPILPVKPPYGNVWVFAFSMLLKRRFYSDFLYSGCTITPKFFCGHVKEIVDPYSMEYLNESEKRCHE